MLVKINVGVLLVPFYRLVAVFFVGLDLIVEDTHSNRIGNDIVFLDRKSKRVVAY